jgi:hypothetical protein
MTENTESTEKRVVGGFDIRFVIAGLIGVYGLILVLLGIFHATDAELDRADGFNVNLWAGLGMLVAAAIFATWGRLRPIVVPESVLAEADGEDDASGQEPPG